MATSPIQLKFEGGYTPPSGANLVLKWSVEGYVPATGVLDASWVGEGVYLGSSSLRSGSFSGVKLIQPGGSDHFLSGTLDIRWDKILVYPTGLNGGFGEPRFFTDLQYPGHKYAIDATWFGKNPYTPPIHAASVSFSASLQAILTGFDASVIPSPLVSKQQFVSQNGFDASLFGQTAALFPWQYVPSEAQVDASWVGKDEYNPYTSPLDGQWQIPSEDNYISIVGESFTEFGSTDVRSAVLYITHGGKPSDLAFGSAKIFNRNTYVTSVTVGNAAAFGGAKFAGGVRFLLASGVAAPSVGIAWASFSPRFVEPAGIQANFYTIHQVGYNRSVQPQGFDASAFGTRIIPEATNLYPLGFVATEFSWPWVSSGKRYLAPPGFRLHQADHLRFGSQYVWNSRQYVQLEYDVNSDLAGEEFGIWQKIENRNRVIAHHSTAPGFLPSPQVDNKARQLKPTGIQSADPGEFERIGLVAYRIRYLPLTGFETQPPSRWGVVRNDASLLRPVGSNLALYGRPEVVNTRRYYRNVSGGEMSVYGQPMVAFGVRTISFEARYTIDSPQIQLPEVKLYTRYVQAQGHDSYQTGAQHLHIHWNIIAPRWLHNEYGRYGSAGVRNKTPMLLQRGADSAEFGDTSIRTQWRNVITSETFTERFGKPKVADRRQFVEPVSIQFYRMSDKLTVIRAGGEPPSIQWITIPPSQAIGYYLYQGAWLPQPVVDHGYGKPAVTGMTLFPIGIEAPPQMFGNPSMRLMSIIGAGVGSYIEFPPAPTVTLKRRYIVTGKPVTMSEEEWSYKNIRDAYGKPRIDPFTIWAVVEAPHQARINHPSTTTLHYVDQSPSSGLWLKGVGEPSVALRHRAISPQPTVGTAFGEHSLLNRRQIIAPDKIPVPMFGRPVILGYLRYVQVSNNNTASGIEHEFAPAPPQPAVSHKVRVLAPSGVASKVVFGKPLLDYFHRFVSPSGWTSQQLGTAKSLDTPYQWQGLRVGPFVPNIIGGYDASLFGDQFVSLRVRGVSAEGFDSFVSDYDTLGFNDRMRVTRRGVNGPAFQLVRPVGENQSRFAYSDVRPGQRHVRPDGNMDNFRKGAPNA